MSLIKLKRVSKYYYNQNNISCGFEKVNLDLNSGEFVVLTGESGSGKSTLLNVISGLDSYEDGEMYINGEETSHYSEVDYEQYRRKYIGNIFQNFNLVNSYTVYQNIELVLLLNGYKRKDIKKKILDVIETVGLSKFKNTKASKLSGGQKQRVAIARALVKETPIIVADEPTGNLDVGSAKSIMKLLSEISKERLVIIVTHNYEQVEKYATRKITMSDGKIIEDKKIKAVEPVDAIPIEYKNITLANRILLGLRNTFNIKVKFILLVLIYFFLTSLVFSSYSSIRKMDFDSSNEGITRYFIDTSAKRIVINKKDKTGLTDEDYDNINKLSNISSITKDDLFTDIDVYLDSDMFYLSGNLLSNSTIKEVSIGSLPVNDNEIVIRGNKDNYELSSGQEVLFDTKFKMFDNFNNIIKNDFKVVGIIYDKDYYYGKYTIYTNESIIDIARRSNNVRYSDIELTINNKVYKKNSNTIPFTIVADSRVSKGNAMVSEEFSSFCEKNNCFNKPFHLDITNSYYKSSVDFKPNIVFTKNTINNYTGLPKDDYYMYEYYIFISYDDFNTLFGTNPYQASVYVNDIQKLYETKQELEDLGFNTYAMKDMIYSMNGEFEGVVRIIRVVSFFFALVALFFISYFIIRIILKSRNNYYSIIRILGSTRKVSKSLLMLELFNDINIAYFTFIGFILLVKYNLVTNNSISNLLLYFNLKDYIFVYVVLIFMSLLISIRYAKTLFKTSALKTYREEA